MTINNSDRLELYCLYRKELIVESNLDNINVLKYKIPLTRFRLSSHDLMIEKGRHVNRLKSKRICTQCNMNVNKTEYHFLLVCPYYTNLRKQSFNILLSLAKKTKMYKSYVNLIKKKNNKCKQICISHFENWSSITDSS